MANDTQVQTPDATSADQAAVASTSAPATPATPVPSGPPVALMSPDHTSTKMVPPEQLADAKSAGWEPAVKMYNNQDSKQVKWVPSSQIDDAHQAGWYPVLSAKTKSAIESQGIEPSTSGNAAMMAAPLAVPAAVGEAGEAAMAPVADAVSAAGDAIGAGARAMQDYALKTIGSLPKEGATSYLEQHGSGLLGLAAQHPEVLKIAAKYGLPSVSGLLLGWKALNALVGK